MHINNHQKSSNKHRRLDAINILVFLFIAAIVLRLFDLQFLKFPYYQALASGQHQIFENIIPDRGEIYVEDGLSGELYPLALNKKLNLVFGVPKQIEDIKSAAEKLAPILDLKKDDIQKKLEEPGRAYVPIVHKVTDAKVEEIKKLEINGIHFEKEAVRFYPDKTLGAQVLGFVGYKGDKKKGLYGIEGYYDDILAGREGHIMSEKDATGKFILIGSKFMEKGEDGADVVLTMNRLIQFKAEKTIKEAVEKNGSARGSVVIMDPKTGEIIAMASYPNFDPNEYYKVEDAKVFENPSIYNLYEAGSVIKPIVMASALDLNLVSPQTEIFDSGEIKVDQFTIHNFDNKGNGKVTMTKILEQSINIGMVQVGQMIGKERLHDYFKKFGFMDLTGIDLESEVPTNIKDPEGWAKSDLATASFGQGISITEMRLITAYSALANSGKLIKPHIVKKIIYPDGKEEMVHPQDVGQVISPQTSSTISAMMVSVIENGQANTAKVAGYKLGGKSGTAQVPNPSGIGYDPSKRITSFIGFGPIEDPKFIISIKFDYPRGDVYGVTVAAPAFAQLAKDVLQYYQIPPSEK